MDGYRENGARGFLEVHSKRQKSKFRQIYLAVRKQNLSSEGKAGKGTKRLVEQSLSLEVSEITGHSPKQSNLTVKSAHAWLKLGLSAQTDFQKSLSTHFISDFHPFLLLNERNKILLPKLPWICICGVFFFFPLFFVLVVIVFGRCTYPVNNIYISIHRHTWFIY